VYYVQGKMLRDKKLATHMDKKLLQKNEKLSSYKNIVTLKSRYFSGFFIMAFAS
jgi:hypothetical protein